MYEINTHRHEPKNFFAGDFPTLTETGIAGAALDVVGITAAAAEAEEPAVYYMTGEFFAEALVLPDGVEMEALKDAFRKISIFLR